MRISAWRRAERHGCMARTLLPPAIVVTPPPRASLVHSPDCTTMAPPAPMLRLSPCSTAVRMTMLRSKVSFSEM